MPLTCYCDWEPDPGQWYYCGPSKIDISYPRKRGKRCASCGEMLHEGDTCSEYPRVKTPYTEVECNIYGEDGEIPLASDYLCEKCSDLMSAFWELGFECVSPREDLRQLARDYNSDYLKGTSQTDPTQQEQSTTQKQ